MRLDLISSVHIFIVYLTRLWIKLSVLQVLTAYIMSSLFSYSQQLSCSFRSLVLFTFMKCGTRLGPTSIWKDNGRLRRSRYCRVIKSNSSGRSSALVHYYLYIILSFIITFYFYVNLSLYIYIAEFIKTTCELMDGIFNQIITINNQLLLLLLYGMLQQYHHLHIN